jgi:hypothetical protein
MITWTKNVTREIITPFPAVGENFTSTWSEVKVSQPYNANSTLFLYNIAISIIGT